MTILQITIAYANTIRQGLCNKYYNNIQRTIEKKHVKEFCFILFYIVYFLIHFLIFSSSLKISANKIFFLFAKIAFFLMYLIFGQHIFPVVSQTLAGFLSRDFLCSWATITVRQFDQIPSNFTNNREFAWQSVINENAKNKLYLTNQSRFFDSSSL